MVCHVTSHVTCHVTCTITLLLVSGGEDVEVKVTPGVLTAFKAAESIRRDLVSGCD